MIQTTRWKPDTCGCSIDFEWDDSVEEKDRTHTTKDIISKCNSHLSVADKDLMKILLDENQTKNIVLGKIAEIMGFTPKETTDGKVEYSFDADRKLDFKVEGLNVAKAQEISDALAVNSQLDTSKSEKIKSIVSK